MTNTYSSELAKLVANAMLAQRISSMNSISAICEATGANISEIEAAVGMDERIGSKYLRAGIGFGGSCFGKDIRSLVYLAECLGLHEVAGYWQGVLTMNEWQRGRFVRRVVGCLNGTLVGKKVGVLGYAFKKNTSDTRESPALESIKILLEEGPREIAVFDPFCDPKVVREEIGRLAGKQVLRENGGPVTCHVNAYEACMAAHATIIMTDCDEFKNTSSSISTKITTRQSADPRPFERLEPTESEILALHKYLASATRIRDPLQRFEDEPECLEGCQACNVDAGNIERKTTRGERLDWAKIAYHLQTPKWVFDGRGMLDAVEMEKLGVRLESIGRVGWGGI